MELFNEYVRSTRRQFFTGGANLLGSVAGVIGGIKALRVLSDPRVKEAFH